MAVLAGAMYSVFERDACGHVKLFFPHRCDELGEQGTMDAVREGLKRAESYGFQSRYDLLRYLNLLFEFGDGFELHESNAWARPHLEPGRPPSIRMDLLMEDAYLRRLPVAPPPEETAPEDPDEEPSDGFDGVVWEDAGVAADYVPVSIKPEIEPLPLPPKPGSAYQASALDDDDDDDAGIELAPEQEEGVDGGG